MRNLVWQVHRGLDTPYTVIIDEPVDERPTVFDDLTVEQHLRVLDSSDERPGG